MTSRERRAGSTPWQAPSARVLACRLVPRRYSRQQTVLSLADQGQGVSACSNECAQTILVIRLASIA